MTEVKVGGKYLWKPWCMQDGKRVPRDDDEDYGKVVTIVSALPDAGESSHERWARPLRQRG